MSAVLTFLLSLWSGAKWYLIGAGAILVAIGGVLAWTYNSGGEHEKLKQVQQEVVQHQKVHKIETGIDSLPPSDARKRLLRDWVYR